MPVVMVKLVMKMYMILSLKMEMLILHMILKMKSIKILLPLMNAMIQYTLIP